MLNIRTRTQSPSGIMLQSVSFLASSYNASTLNKIKRIKFSYYCYSNPFKIKIRNVYNLKNIRLCARPEVNNTCKWIPAIQLKSKRLCNKEREGNITCATKIEKYNRKLEMRARCNFTGWNRQWTDIDALVFLLIRRPPEPLDWREGRPSPVAGRPATEPHDEPHQLKCDCARVGHRVQK